MKINWRASTLHASVVGLVNTVLAAVVSFGVHITASQEVSIAGVTNAILVLLSAVLISSTNGAGAGKGA